MKNNYTERIEKRINNAARQAEKNLRKADALQKTADRIAYATQGEPVKVGHHSEGRHRRDLDRMDNALRGSIEAQDKANYYTGKAASIGSNPAVSSDDPEAIVKLQEQLDTLVSRQAYMKAANKCIRAGDVEGFLLLPSASKTSWNLLTDESRGKWKGYESFELTNNNASIKRITARIAQLRTDNERTTTTEKIKGVELVLNAEANRVQMIFPCKPSPEVRKKLKKVFAFRWCEGEGAWQRHYNPAGISAARQFLDSYQPE